MDIFAFKVRNMMKAHTFGVGFSTLKMTLHENTKVTGEIN
jgi:hypothetical protein